MDASPSSGWSPRLDRRCRAARAGRFRTTPSRSSVCNRRPCLRSRSPARSGRGAPRRAGAEPTGEALAVVGQDLVGDPVASQRCGQDLGHGLGGRAADQASGDAEPAVVVHAGDHLQLRGVGGEQNPSHHVHLPQLHRTLSLPAAELVTALAPAPELDQLVPTHAPVGGRTRGRRVHARRVR